MLASQEKDWEKFSERWRCNCSGDRKWTNLIRIVRRLLYRVTSPWCGWPGSCLRGLSGGSEKTAYTVWWWPRGRNCWKSFGGIERQSHTYDSDVGDETHRDSYRMISSYEHKGFTPTWVDLDILCTRLSLSLRDQSLIWKNNTVPWLFSSKFYRNFAHRAVVRPPGLLTQ